MKALTLFDALNIIQEGRASEVIDHLHAMHRQSSQDLLVSYVLAHALGACELHSRAESIWNAIADLNHSSVVKPQKHPQPSDAEVFVYNDSLQAKLNIILESQEEDDMDQLIRELSAGERKSFHEVEEIPIEEIPEDEVEQDPITETFARILVAQKKYAEAAAVYRSLSETNPDDKDRLLEEANKLDHLANSETDS